MPHREGFGQESEAGMKGKPRLEPYSLKKARQSRVEGLGLASLNKPHGLWAMGFPDSSVGKEFACNAGDPGLIPGSGRYAGEGIGYPLQYSWASLVAQLVKNPPAMWET